MSIIFLGIIEKHAVGHRVHIGVEEKWGSVSAFSALLEILNN
jgi:hypothetical protein